VELATKVARRGYLKRLLVRALQLVAPWEESEKEMRLRTFRKLRKILNRMRDLEERVQQLEHALASLANEVEANAPFVSHGYGCKCGDVDCDGDWADPR